MVLFYFLIMEPSEHEHHLHRRRYHQTRGWRGKLTMPITGRRLSDQASGLVVDPSRGNRTSGPALIDLP